MSDRKWWPEFLVDESMPAGREHPTDWIKEPVGDLYAIYNGDEDDPVEELRKVAPGEQLDFMWSEDRGSVEITLNDDGTFVAHGPVPPDASNFWLQGDPDTTADSMEEFAANYTEIERDLRAAFPVRLLVSMYVWSDYVPHRLVITPDGPRFALRDGGK